MKYVEYKCTGCDFFSINKTAFERHCKTPKHIKNINKTIDFHNISLTSKNKIDDYNIKNNKFKMVLEDKKEKNENDSDVDIKNRPFQCKYCKYDFTKSCNLMKHIKSCPEKPDKNDDIIKIEGIIAQKDFTSKLTETELKLKHEQELKETYRKELEYYKSLLTLAGGMVQTTVSALTYVVNTYDDAPDIEPIKFSDVQKVKNIDNEKLISKIFYHYNRNKLGQYIGDAIVEIYKKKDPSEQSIWSTDTSRLTYLLKKILFNDKSKWSVDKKGVATIEYLITPVIDKVRDMAIEYQEEKCFGDGLDPDRVILINDIFSRLMIDIDNKKIHNDILKYISPHFYVNHKTIKN